MGFIFDPAAQGRSAGLPAGDHDRARAASFSTPCPSRWSRSSTTSRSTEHGTCAELLRRRQGRPARAVLRADGPALAAHRPAATVSRCARRAGPLRRRLPHQARAVRHGADALRPPVPARPPNGDGERAVAAARCSSENGFDRAAARADPRGPSATAGSAWPRTACRPTPSSRRRRPATWSTRAGSTAGTNSPKPVARPCADGAVAVVSLAAGAGSRWTQGAGVVKALHPFCKLGGKHRSSSKSTSPRAARTGKHVRRMPAARPHHQLPHPRADRSSTSAAETTTATPARCTSRPAASIGLRLIPMVRDLRFAWEEMPQQIARRAAAEGAREPSTPP